MIDMAKNQTDFPILHDDSYLKPYQDAIYWRNKRYQDKLDEIKSDFGSLKNFASGHKYLGFNPGENETGKAGVWYREWAPEALSLSLTGDFNNWSRFSHPMKKDDFGVWSIFLEGETLQPGSRVKVHVATKKHTLDRIPAYIQQLTPDEQQPADLVGVYFPSDDFQWQHKSPKRPQGLRIYETHVGIAQERYGVGNFQEFRENILPRIKKLGYNTIQLMAIAEHPYYASFGYQVSNFFAVSHRFGSPTELKHLIDEAHKLGLFVLLDLVHSHTVKNLNEGLNEFDGSDFQYFHSGPQGDHPAWDTKLFNYGKTEVLRFLLSNVAFWLEEFKFDGFRFDGVTSMLYKHHGLGMDFDHYDHYFNEKEVDRDAITYLQLANTLTKEINPQAITIAEDVSGMPGIARKVEEGGIGFDYRLAMGLPDFWIKLLKHSQDEAWSMREIYDTMVNRRFSEKHVAYAESHDQALVGDKTIAFWLMDQHMYWHMGKTESNPVVDRGIALHKLIRLLTFSLGGEAYLNFMGNEFGHPEWIDFPREGNNNSFHFARRQWSLVDNSELKYQYLNNFDQVMHKLDQKTKILTDQFIEPILQDDKSKLLVFRRGPLVFAYNFHPETSYADLEIGVPDPNDYQIILDTDESRFGGFARVKKSGNYPLQPVKMHHRDQSLKIYLPSRTAQVLRPMKK